jgi:hypothetical protein
LPPCVPSYASYLILGPESLASQALSSLHRSSWFIDSHNLPSQIQVINILPEHHQPLSHQISAQTPKNLLFARFASSQHTNTLSPPHGNIPNPKTPHHRRCNPEHRNTGCDKRRDGLCDKNVHDCESILRRALCNVKVVQQYLEFDRRHSDQVNTNFKRGDRSG